MLEWQGQPSLLDIGPYTAVLSLAYGEDGTKSLSETIEFWVLPIDQILEILFGVLIVAAIFAYILRRSVRRMLEREMSKYGGAPPAHAKPSRPSGHDVIDLRNSKGE